MAKRSMKGMKPHAPTFLSLFSGAGGFDLGFVQAGFECIGAFDSDAYAIDVYNRNLGHSATLCDLSTGLPPSPPAPNVDVLIAGPPCQGFSTAGTRDPDDPRNLLLTVPAKIARVLSPKVIVVENVRGVTAGDHRKHWDKLVKMLRAQGYKVAEFLCNAVQHGVPQIRHRLLLIAWNTGHDVNINIEMISGGTLGDVLGNLEDVANHTPKPLPPKSDAAKIAMRIQAGQKLCNVRAGQRSVHTWDIPEVFGRTSKKERTVLEALLRLRRRNRIRRTGDADPVSLADLSTIIGADTEKLIESLERKCYIRKVGKRYDLVNTFNGKYRRLSLAEPSPTVDTRFGQSRYFLHPAENRSFTVREAARIQGFPDTFVFAGPMASQYRLVGNAVPPPLARLVASFVRNAFFL